MPEKRNYNQPRTPNLDNMEYSGLIGIGVRTMDSSMPLADYILAWMELFKKNTVKQATYDRLVTSVQALRPFAIADKRIGDINFFDIQRYINELVAAKYSLSTIKKQLRIVTAPLKQAAALRIISSDPSVGVRLPSEENVLKAARSKSAYNDAEQRRLWGRILPSDKPGYQCVGLMLETGMRAGEALALRWKDIDILRRRVRIHATVVRLANKKQSFVQESPKSHSSIRTIPLTDRAASILEKLQDTAQTEWVFESDGERLSYEALRYQTQRLCKEADVPCEGEHVLRHTFATNCYYKGVDIKVLSKILGHSDVNITYNVYIHLYGDAFDEMYAALNR